MSISLGFHGAARTVTGSRYLLDLDGNRTVIDCGLFQGHKALRKLNWREPPFEPGSVDRVLLTHAHIDHIGALPRLVKQGFSGPVHCTSATRELAKILLVDSAEIHEEDARYANKKKYSKHDPALPLYTVSDAKQTLKLLEKVQLDKWVPLGKSKGGVAGRARYVTAGHILGSTSIEVVIERKGKKDITIVFSGDVGRYDMPLHVDPTPCPPCDVLICESTYGSRDHNDIVPVPEQLRMAIQGTIDRGGTVLIPAFAVGRSQQLTYIIRELIQDGELPDIPIHIDSPMAVDATHIYGQHMNEHQLDPEVFEHGKSRLFPDHVDLCRSVKQSKALNDKPGPRVIISASGMMTAGRVVHHLARLAGDRKNLIMVAGYQAAGTRGRQLLDGRPTIRMHGREIKVRARIMSLHGLSAHAGRDELMRFVTGGGAAPHKVYLTHGEPESSFALAQLFESELNWDAEVPELDEVIDLEQLVD